MGKTPGTKIGGDPTAASPLSDHLDEPVGNLEGRHLPVEAGIETFHLSQEEDFPWWRIELVQER